MSVSTPDPRNPWVDTPVTQSGMATEKIESQSVKRRSVRSDLALLTAFWIYVALSNILYANSLQASLSQMGLHNFFARWDARLLQHVLLYPVLIGAVCLSRRIGWQPMWRTIPLQVICGVVFAALGSPMMGVAEHLFKRPNGMSMPADPSTHDLGSGLVSVFGTDKFTWLSTGTNFFLSYAFCLALLSGFEFYRRLRDAQMRTAALERSLSAAQLTALRMQLSPHTLFNLLHTIRGNIAWDPTAAQSMIVQLGELLRRLLRAGERDLSRLEDEIDFVRLYLELQRKRFEDRLSVSVADPAALSGAWIPSLILQPLVENAITHGLANHRGPVAIRVEIEAPDDMLALRVVNSVPKEQAIGESAMNGIGLRNVRERLKVQFGGRASFRAGLIGDEWVAEIRLPLMRSQLMDRDVQPAEGS